MKHFALAAIAASVFFIHGAVYADETTIYDEAYSGQGCGNIRAMIFNDFTAQAEQLPSTKALQTPANQSTVNTANVIQARGAEDFFTYTLRNTNTKNEE